MHEPALILLRGLPGSGKSSLALLLSEHGKYPVYSIDDYFTSEDGSYQFDFRENHIAYKQCEDAVLNEIVKGSKKIFIHNTFTLEWEMEPYFKMAAAYKYYLFIVTVENRLHHNNIHQVSNDQLQKMAEKYKVVLF